MPTFHGQTVDLWEDFEDALGAGWTAADPDTNLSLAAGAAYAGAQGFRMDQNGASGTPDAAYESYNTGAERTDLSVGFWYRGPAYTGDPENAIIFNWGNSNGGTTNVRAYWRKASGVYRLAIRGTAFSTGVTVSTATWYWVTIDLNKNGTCTLRVYDTTGTQVGSDDTCTANNSACNYLIVGATSVGARDENVNHDWDDFVADWTDATWPLLGWDTGGGATVPIHLLRPQIIPDFFSGRT